MLFLFQVQVLKLLLNLSENPAMTEGLLGAQVNSLYVCFVNIQMCRFGQIDLDGFIPFKMLTEIISEEQYCVMFFLWFFLPTWISQIFCKEHILLLKFVFEKVSLVKINSNFSVSTQFGIYLYHHLFYTWLGYAHMYLLSTETLVWKEFPVRARCWAECRYSAWVQDDMVLVLTELTM